MNDMTDQNQPAEDDGNPKFGRLLLVLLAVVALIGVLTFATEAYYR